MEQAEPTFQGIDGAGEAVLANVAATRPLRPALPAWKRLVQAPLRRYCIEPGRLRQRDAEGMHHLLDGETEHASGGRRGAESSRPPRSGGSRARTAPPARAPGSPCRSHRSPRRWRSGSIFGRKRRVISAAASAAGMADGLGASDAGVFIGSKSMEWPIAPLTSAATGGANLPASRRSSRPRRRFRLRPAPRGRQHRRRRIRRRASRVRRCR